MAGEVLEQVVEPVRMTSEDILHLCEKTRHKPVQTSKAGTARGARASTFWNCMLPGSAHSAMSKPQGNVLTCFLNREYATSVFTAGFGGSKVKALV